MNLDRRQKNVNQNGFDGVIGVRIDDDSLELESVSCLEFKPRRDGLCLFVKAWNPLLVSCFGGFSLFEKIKPGHLLNVNRQNFNGYGFEIKRVFDWQFERGLDGLKIRLYCPVDGYVSRQGIVTSIIRDW